MDSLQNNEKLVMLLCHPIQLNMHVYKNLVKLLPVMKKTI